MVKTTNRTTIFRILLIMEDLVKLDNCGKFQLEFYTEFVLDQNNYIISALY